MTDVVLLLAQMALSIAVPAWIVRFDLARRKPQELARAWNDATFWSAIVAFGPLSLPVHFIKTRRSLWGFLWGMFWMVAATAAISGPALALEGLLEGVPEHDATRRF